MSAKQIIKSIVPKSAWKKACSIKDTMEASKARRIQGSARRFAHLGSCPSMGR